MFVRPNPKTKFEEWEIQNGAVRRLQKMILAGTPIAYAGDMNAGRRGPREMTRAVATGMMAGEPDLRVYMPGGRLGFIEFKTRKGVLSDSQKVRHPLLRGLGFPVTVIKVATPEEAAEVTEAVVRSWLVAANDNKKQENQ